MWLFMLYVLLFIVLPIILSLAIVNFIKKLNRNKYKYMKKIDRQKDEEVK